MSSRTPAQEPERARWEVLVLEAVGRVIEYWGFKRNHGRVWALLYLLDEPMTAAAIGKQTGLSKGAVSMVLRELEAWAVVRRAPVNSRSGVGFRAENDLWLMVTTVLRQREARLVDLVWRDLREAEHRAEADRSLPAEERRAVARRIRRLRRFAEVGRAALEGFIRSFRLDLEPLAGVLRATLRRAL